ncbi:MAG TPA: hypothetical protein VKU80_00290, partial [Planctomycetota bacterium]|nr:hypothetical protein [Planctomycetota bacterium]
EAPEYSLLARFAESLKISLPDLRVRVNRRMQGLSDRNTRAQPRRESMPPAPPPGPRRVEAPPRPSPPTHESAPFMQTPTPMTAPPPTPLPKEFPNEPKVADLPPVTLQLLKQSIMFDNETDSVAGISRTLGIPADRAAQIRLAILDAFPDLKPGSQAIRQVPRR